MNYSVSSLFFICWIIIAIWSPAKTCYGDLNSALHKHALIQVTQKSFRKLQQFDHLIRYFSGFSYFVPNHQVNPDFIRALILAESAVTPDAVSKKDALGLGQIIPSTGKAAARELAKSSISFRYVSKARLNNLKREDLFDPAVNILLTCYLIAKYNHRFSGRLDLVVSAWNAGENTQSLKYGNHAPYQETEDLIGKINGYFVYLMKHNRFR